MVAGRHPYLAVAARSLTGEPMSIRPPGAAGRTGEWPAAGDAAELTGRDDVSL
jgi:hypothetical protein